jgi:DNA-binding NtrC family response regulator
MATILYVDDEPVVGPALVDALQRAGHRTIGARTVPEALAALERGGVDLALAPYRMHGRAGSPGIELLALTRRGRYAAPLIMLTDPASDEQAAESLAAGALDHLPGSASAAQIERVVGRALELARLRRENAALRDEVAAFRTERQIVGESAAVRRVLQTVAMAAPTHAAVLLQGESGTGKELFARAIHDQSARRDQPFVRLDCAALPEGAVESALFGREEGGTGAGAFADAFDQPAGALERAHRGTLLLDEISEMRLDLQARLLRVLQEQEFQRVGGTSPVRVDVRVVATTSRDLAAAAAAGTFRKDLYYRLSVVTIQVPPLRERPEDIPLLVSRFATRTGAEIGRRIDGVAPAAIELLQRRSWPGNVRELQHAVERAVVLSPDTSVVPLQAFEGYIVGSAPGGQPAASARAVPTTGIAPGIAGVMLTSFNVAEAERVLIQHALAAVGNNRTRAAELLGISVRTLRNKLNGARSAAESREWGRRPLGAAD